MAVEDPTTIDAAGIDGDRGCVVLTIADDWDWEDEPAHLLALQAKLNIYFTFVESGQAWELYPETVGKQVVIDVIGRFPLPQSGIALLRQASDVSSDLVLTITNHHYPGTHG